MLSRSPAVRQAFAISLCALILATGAAAKPPKGPKPKNPPPAGTPAQSSTPASQPAKPGPEPPPPGLDAVGEKLWHYQTAAARDSLSSFLDKADSNAYVATAYGRVLEQQKSYGDAETRLRKAASLAPDDPAPYVYLGEVLLRQRRDADASAAFRHAADAARAKGGADAAYFLGVAQQRLKQYDDAVATLSGARAPQPALIPYQIGVTRAFQGKWQEAADQLTAAIGQDSGLAYAYYYRGRAAEKMGRKDMLVNDMNRFLALAPNAPEADDAKAVLRAVKP